MAEVPRRRWRALAWGPQPPRPPRRPAAALAPSSAAPGLEAEAEAVIAAAEPAAGLLLRVQSGLSPKGEEADPDPSSITLFLVAIMS